tara:strand:+ start:3274 stop:3690 length:417 start_codon:yes stop_codon:yes gene_type:complete
MARYIDNQDGTVIDSQTKLIWAQKDSWQRDGKWVTFDEAMEFARHLADLKLGGSIEWHLPTIEEAKSLFDPSQSILDKYGKEVHLNPVFPEGCLGNLWIHEIATGNEGYFINMMTGEVGRKFKSVAGRMSVRPVFESK